MGIILDITGHNKHVPEIERSIRTVKERVWVTVNTLSSEKYPNILMWIQYKMLYLVKLFSTQEWNTSYIKPTDHYHQVNCQL